MSPRNDLEYEFIKVRSQSLASLSLFSVESTFLTFTTFCDSDSLGKDPRKVMSQDEGLASCPVPRRGECTHTHHLACRSHITIDLESLRRRDGAHSVFVELDSSRGEEVKSVQDYLLSPDESVVSRNQSARRPPGTRLTLWYRGLDRDQLSCTALTLVFFFSCHYAHVLNLFNNRNQGLIMNENLSSISQASNP